MITKILTAAQSAKQNKVFYGFSTDPLEVNQVWGFDLEENSNWSSDLSSGLDAAAFHATTFNFPFRIFAAVEGLNVNDLYMYWIALPQKNPNFYDYDTTSEEAFEEFQPLSDSWNTTDVTTTDFNNVPYTIYKLKGQRGLDDEYTGSIIVNHEFSIDN